jgi:hypothetical protein
MQPLVMQCYTCAMRFRPIAILVFAWLCTITVKAAAPIELELATEQGLQITAPREWLQLLTSAGIDNVRIRGAAAGDEPTVVNRGTAERPRYHVLGILTPRDQLRLPGGTFGRGDRARIKDYFNRLVADGAESLTAPLIRFGLTEKELAAVFADLTQPIDFETKGQSPRKVIERLQEKLAHKFAVEAEAGAALHNAKQFGDELKGVTVGTGVAILLRNYGLVMRPEKLRGWPVAYRVKVADADAVAQSTMGKESDNNPTRWPIGWEPDTAPVKLAPSLFQQLNAEIDGYTLAETLAAIGPKVKLPMFIDHAALTERKIHPVTIQVKLPPTRTTYHRVLSRVLTQAHLGMSLRVDEAGRPFVWITR